MENQKCGGGCERTSDRRGPPAKKLEGAENCPSNNSLVQRDNFEVSVVDTNQLNCFERVLRPSTQSSIGCVAARTPFRRIGQPERNSSNLYSPRKDGGSQRWGAPRDQSRVDTVTVSPLGESACHNKPRVELWHLMILGRQLGVSR